MALKKHIPASSIAEVVIAIAVIATCIGISALVFSRSLMVTMDFESLRQQTEIQCDNWEQMILGEDPTNGDGLQLSEEEDTENPGLKVIEYKGNNERILWKQNWLMHE